MSVVSWPFIWSLFHRLSGGVCTDVTRPKNQPPGERNGPMTLPGCAAQSAPEVPGDAAQADPAAAATCSPASPGPSAAAAVSSAVAPFTAVAPRSARSLWHPSTRASTSAIWRSCSFTFVERRRAGEVLRLDLDDQNPSTPTNTGLRSPFLARDAPVARLRRPEEHGGRLLRSKPAFCVARPCAVAAFARPPLGLGRDLLRAFVLRAAGLVGHRMRDDLGELHRAGVGRVHRA